MFLRFSNGFDCLIYSNLNLCVFIYSFFRANLSAVIQEKSCQRSLNQKLPADYPHLLSTMIPRIKSLIYCEKVCQKCWKFAKIQQPAQRKIQPVQRKICQNQKSHHHQSDVAHQPNHLNLITPKDQGPGMKIWPFFAIFYNNLKK